MSTTNRTFLTLAVVAIACFALTTTAQAALIIGQTFESINVDLSTGPLGPVLTGTENDLGLEGYGKRYSTVALAADENFELGAKGWDLEGGGSHGGTTDINSNKLTFNHATSGSHWFTFKADAKYTPPTDLFTSDSRSVMAKFDVADVSGYTDKVLTFDLVNNSLAKKMFFRLFLDGGTGIDIMTINSAAPSLAGGATYTAGTVSISIADTVNTVELFMGGQHDPSNGTIIDNVSITGVPEPATMALLGLGGLGLILGRKRR